MCFCVCLQEARLRGTSASSFDVGGVAKRPAPEREEAPRGWRRASDPSGQRMLDGVWPVIPRAQRFMERDYESPLKDRGVLAAERALRQGGPSSPCFKAEARARVPGMEPHQMEEYAKRNEVTAEVKSASQSVKDLATTYAASQRMPLQDVYKEQLYAVEVETADLLRKTVSRNVGVVHEEALLVDMMHNGCNQMLKVAAAVAGPANAPSVALLRQEAKGVWDAASSVSAGRHQFVRLLLGTQRGVLEQEASMARFQAMASGIQRNVGGPYPFPLVFDGHQPVGGPRPLTLPRPPKPERAQAPTDRVPGVCDSWRKQGSCTRGPSCNFAHEMPRAPR